jgi:hypothetical protein
MYTIGTPIPASRLHNCSHSTKYSSLHSTKKSAVDTAADYKDADAVLSTPGRTPGNLESNVTLYTRCAVSTIAATSLLET